MFIYPRQISSDSVSFLKKIHVFSFQTDQLSDPVAQLTILIPGVYEFYVSYDGGRGKRGTLVVEPRLVVQELVLPLDAINLLTVVPKWLPPISKWQNHFQNYANTGYNMVHFAPLNQRGISNSPYALYDQLSISPDLFEVSLSKEEQEKLLIQTLDQIRHMGIIPVTDIVWNHTACNSEWLELHPDAGKLQCFNIRL
jgi:glycogen debranching enzyme